MPSPVADVSRPDIAPEAAKALRVDDIETSSGLNSCRDCKGENRGKGVSSPGRNRMKVDAGCAVAIDPVGKYVYFMFAGEPTGQFRHIAAVAAGAVVVMNDECNFHPPAGRELW